MGRTLFWFLISASLSVCSCTSKELAVAPTQPIPSSENVAAGTELPQEMPLLREAALGNVRAVKQGLSNRANLNTRDALGSTPLHVAARNGKIEVVRLLLENGADINARDSFGKTPLFYAVHTDEKQTADLLTSKGGVQ